MATLVLEASESRKLSTLENGLESERVKLLRVCLCTYLFYLEYDLEECLVEDAPFASSKKKMEDLRGEANSRGGKDEESLTELKVFGERAIAINKENKGSFYRVFLAQCF